MLRISREEDCQAGTGRGFVGTRRAARRSRAAGECGGSADYSRAVTHWSFEPLQVASVLLLAALYARRVVTLRERGTAPPVWRICLFALGIVFLLVALVSPIDYYAERSFG